MPRKPGEIVRMAIVLLLARLTGTSFALLQFFLVLISIGPGPVYLGTSHFSQLRVQCEKKKCNHSSVHISIGPGPVFNVFLFYSKKPFQRPHFPVVLGQYSSSSCSTDGDCVGECGYKEEDGSEEGDEFEDCYCCDDGGCCKDGNWFAEK